MFLDDRVSQLYYINFILFRLNSLILFHFRMINKAYAAAIITVFLSFTIIFPICLTCSLLTVLLIISILFGIFTALWMNILLSLPHKTTVGAEHLIKQTESFRNKIMVRV